MRKLSVLSTRLVLGLVVGLVGFSFAVDTRAGTENGNTGASWSNSSANSCWITITEHTNVTLTPTDTSKSAPYKPTTVLENTGNTITVNNNCKTGVSVDVQVTDTSAPDGFSDNVLTDFYWKVSNNAAQFSPANGVTSYNKFSGTGDDGTVQVGSTSNPARFTFETDYKYVIDNKDIGGDYSVSLQYTVTG